MSRKRVFRPTTFGEQVRVSCYAVELGITPTMVSRGYAQGGRNRNWWWPFHGKLPPMSIDADAASFCSVLLLLERARSGCGECPMKTAPCWAFISGWR